MLWNVIDKKEFTLYINRDIDLKIKVYEENDCNEVYINYKGYNLTTPMLAWEFGEDLSLASIDNVRLGGDSPFDKHFIINKKDINNFLEEIYFFLVENDMHEVLKEKYRASWNY